MKREIDLEKRHSTIHKIPQEFEGKGEVRGYCYERCREGEDFLIYKVSFEGGIWFEVFERRITPICIDFEQREYSDTEFKERQPKSKDFGIWAWTYKSEESAINKAEELV